MSERRDFDDEETILEHFMEYRLGAEEFKDWCRMYPSSSEYKAWDKVISIDNWTFADCPQLKKLILPSKLVEVGYKVFENSNNIEEICFDNGEKKTLNGQFIIENGYLYDAFSRTVLKVFSNAQVIEIPEGVKKLDRLCFAGLKNLRKVILPESLVSKEIPFAGCDSLQEVIISEKNEIYEVRN